MARKNTSKKAKVIIFLDMMQTMYEKSKEINSSKI